MDIRKRLQISNVVMIAVPVVIALVVGIVCILVTWTIVTGGAPFGGDALRDYLGITGFTEQTEHGLKLLVWIVALVLLLVVIAAVALTDRFLTRFVLGHITGPLDELTAGVEQIRNGNLDYRIGYAGDDEFAPVCDAFDEMALRLADSVERDRRDEEARKELIAGLSHDLRGPLTSIRGYAEGLRDGVPADEGARTRYVEVIIDKATDIEHRVSQLLAMTKLDMAGYRIEKQALSLDGHVRALLDRERDEFDAHGMEVDCELEPAVVFADSAELDRILDNLLDNSLKYRRGRKVRVEVTVRDTDEGGVLTVSDDGMGVPQEDLERIFDPLYRGDAARGGTQGGSGLGLSIVAASVAGMGGSVEAACADGGGLVIRIRLPHAGGEEVEP